MPGKLGFYITDEFNMRWEKNTIQQQIDHSVIQQIILKSYLAGELCSTMHTLLELFAADSDMFHKLLNISKHDNVPICLIES